jgi:hypothetical protein
MTATIRLIHDNLQQTNQSLAVIYVQPSQTAMIYKRQHRNGPRMMYSQNVKKDHYKVSFIYSMLILTTFLVLPPKAFVPGSGADSIPPAFQACLVDGSAQTLQDPMPFCSLPLEPTLWWFESRTLKAHVREYRWCQNQLTNNHSYRCNMTWKRQINSTTSHVLCNIYLQIPSYKICVFVRE